MRFAVFKRLSFEFVLNLDFGARNTRFFICILRAVSRCDVLRAKMRFSLIAVFVAIVISVTAALLAPFFRHSPSDHYHAAEQRLLEKCKSHSGNRVGVMTFNVRFDGPDPNDKQHFSSRVNSISSIISTWRPAVVGLQEPFAPQLHHILAVLARNNSKYQKVSSKQHSSSDLLHPRAHDDYNTAIIYDPQRLELVGSALVWLSDTPSVPHSRFDSHLAVRTLTVARFLHLHWKKHLLAFNTHLEVKSESVRRKQSLLMRKVMQEWRARFPGDAVFATGDFNSAPGQAAHRTLLPADDSMRDAWETCLSVASCEQERGNQLALSFNGFLHVAIIDSYLARALAPILFTLHAMQLQLPHHVPNSIGEVARVARDLCFKWPEYSIAESMPNSWHRLHVDWILHDVTRATPRVMAVVDAHRTHPASDHYAVVGHFDLI